ncbi:MAG TPA: ferritin-like domain-containing protein [Sphingobacteriaceae bacterium]
MKRESNAKSTGASNEKDKLALMKLFHDELKDIYFAEKHLLKAMPKMAKSCTSEELRSGIEMHATQTEGQIERLEKVFELMGKKASSKTCEAMKGLVEEGKGILEDTESGTMTRDAGIISALQKIEHYEIASYGTLRTLANVLGLNEAAALLEETLEEEKQTDVKLTQIAEGFVNQQATAEQE